MLTKAIALPLAVAIFPAYYRWMRRQEQAKQRYRSHQIYRGLVRDLTANLASLDDMIHVALAQRVAHTIAAEARTSLGTYQSELAPGPQGR